jgi:dTDP-glucose 4,6-dehydratase
VIGMRAVVLGGAGFVGSHLCERLLEEGAAVVAVDNFLTGTEKNLRGLRGRPGFKFLEQDIVEGLSVEGAVDYVLTWPLPPRPSTTRSSHWRRSGWARRARRTR